MLVPFGNSGGKGVSFHHGALVATAFLFDGCFVLTTPNEIIANTLHFVSWLGVHRLYYTKKDCSIRESEHAAGGGKGGGYGRLGRGSRR
jgi:hypothetical protein